MATSLLVICIGTGFTTSGAATNSLSLTTAPGYSERTRDGAGPSAKAIALSPLAPGIRVGSAKCPTARQGLRFYSRRYNEWRSKMGAETRSLLPRVASATPRACPRYLANLWRAKAHAQRRAYERWHAELQRKLLDAQFAICYVFGAYCSEALRVVECESGGSRHAHNGQYLGLFQMGEYARSRYGHSDTFLGQARAAYRYFAASGFDWSPWACRP